MVALTVPRVKHYKQAICIKPSLLSLGERAPVRFAPSKYAPVFNIRDSRISTQNCSIRKTIYDKHQHSRLP